MVVLVGRVQQSHLPHASRAPLRRTQRSSSRRDLRTKPELRIACTRRHRGAACAPRRPGAPSHSSFPTACRPDCAPTPPPALPTHHLGVTSTGAHKVDQANRVHPRERSIPVGLCPRLRLGSDRRILPATAKRHGRRRAHRPVDLGRRPQCGPSPWSRPSARSPGTNDCDQASAVPADVGFVLTF
jgi:hypothetical protein